MSGIQRPDSGGGGGGSSTSETVTRPYTAGIAVGDAVYQKGDGSVDKSNATSTATMPVLGIVMAIDSPAPGQCMVQTSGDMFGFSGLTAGRIYLASKDPGQIIWEGDIFNPFYPLGQFGNVTQQVGIAGSSSLLSVIIHDIEEQ